MSIYCVVSFSLLTSLSLHVALIDEGRDKRSAIAESATRDELNPILMDSVLPDS